MNEDDTFRALKKATPGQLKDMIAEGTVFGRNFNQTLSEQGSRLDTVLKQAGWSWAEFIKHQVDLMPVDQQDMFRSYFNSIRATVKES